MRWSSFQMFSSNYHSNGTQLIIHFYISCFLVKRFQLSELKWALRGRIHWIIRSYEISNVTLYYCKISNWQFWSYHYFFLQINAPRKWCPILSMPRPTRLSWTLHESRNPRGQMHALKYVPLRFGELGICKHRPPTLISINDCVLRKDENFRDFAICPEMLPCQKA